MKKYILFYGLSGGFGGATNHHIVEVENESDAESEAFQLAVEVYESYEGLHGLRAIEEIISEEDVEEAEAEDIYKEEREGWLEYYAEEWDSVKHANYE